jgi:hypothetical protein
LTVNVQLEIWDDPRYPIVFSSLLPPPIVNSQLPKKPATKRRRKTASVELFSTPFPDVSSTDASETCQVARHVTSLLKADAVMLFRKFLGWEDIRAEWENFLQLHPPHEVVSVDFVEQMRPRCVDLINLCPSSELYQVLYAEADCLQKAINMVFSRRLSLLNYKSKNKPSLVQLRHGVNCCLGSKIFP